jgi:hypothetical protein
MKWPDAEAVTAICCAAMFFYADYIMVTASPPAWFFIYIVPAGATIFMALWCLDRAVRGP